MADTPTREELEHQVRGLKGQVTKLKTANATLREQLAQQTKLSGNYVGEVPADRPRDMYSATDPVRIHTFMNASEAEAAQAAQPDHWFALKQDARDAYAASQANT